MKNKVLFSILVWALVLGLSGCAKTMDLDRPIDVIKKEVETMSVQDLEANAMAYAAELKTQKAELDKIKEKMKTLPVEQIFSNHFMTSKVAKIGRKAEALFQRYVIYAGKLQEKGADLSKIRLD